MIQPLVSQMMSTPDGPFVMIEDTAGAVIAAGWTDDVAALVSRSGIGGALVVPGVCDAAAAVEAYYSGALDAPLAVPVVTAGTAFQQQVWGALRAIPAGQSRTYGELAASVGSPAAVRAVGSACARNRVALFVPCHRIVGAGGSLTGFAWGMDVKRRLLEREGVLPSVLML